MVLQSLEPEFEPEPIESDLLDVLRLEFGDNGRRAAEFLITAHAFLGLDKKAFPSIGHAVAYCLREAMTSVLDTANIGPSVTWKNASRKVVEEYNRYKEKKHDKDSSDLPNADSEGALVDLFERITDLKDFHSKESWHQKRMIALMRSLIGAESLPSGIRSRDGYQKLLNRLNDSLHSSSSDIKAGQLWSDCIDILRRLFIPPKARSTKLGRLAQNKSPTLEDGEVVSKLLASPQQLRYFMNKVISPAWLDVLEPTGILDPPSSEDYWWPSCSGVLNLAKTHREEVIVWLKKKYDSHGANPKSAWYIANAALNITDPEIKLVLKAVKDHPQHGDIAWLAVRAVEKLDASDDLVESFADLLFNETSWSTGWVYARPLIEQFAGGVNENNALRRIKLLSYKIRAVSNDDYGLHKLVWDPSRSVTDQDEFSDGDRFEELRSCMVDAMERAWACKVPIDELLDLFEGLPNVLRKRLRSWTLGNAPCVDPDLLVEEVERVVSSRRRTGDDLALINRAVKECEPSTYVDRWQKALGSAPTVEQACRAIAKNAVPPEWWRVLELVSLLPDEVTSTWKTPCEIITAPYGLPNRESLETTRAEAKAVVERSPFSLDELLSMDVEGAASVISGWRPEPDDLMTTPVALARTLESVVRDAPGRWLISPVQIATKLYHPTYISHYLLAVADVVSNHGFPVEEIPVEELLAVIKLARIAPWQPEPLSDDRDDYENDWTDTQMAAINLIKALAESDCTFGDSADDLWAILKSEAMNHSDKSQPVIRNEEDPYSSAIDRRSTQALRAVLSLIDNEFRSTEKVRPGATILFDKTLRLDGRSGIEHRSILVTHIGFLRRVLPGWIDANRELLFGDQAPEGFGQIAIDQAIRYSHPNEWPLEHFRGGVYDAVKRDVKNALDHLLLAMLWEIPGYSVENTVAFLRESPELSSGSGERLSRILPKIKPEPPRYLEIFEKFWRAMLKQTKRANNNNLLLPGFGYLSRVEAMNPELWSKLMLKTLEASRGQTVSNDRNVWIDGVAERVVKLPPSVTGLAIMDTLLRDYSDPLILSTVTEKAVHTLDSAQNLKITKEYRQLHNALLERGAIKN